MECTFKEIIFHFQEVTLITKVYAKQPVILTHDSCQDNLLDTTCTVVTIVICQSFMC